ASSPWIMAPPMAPAPMNPSFTACSRPLPVSAIDIALIPRHSLIGPYFGTYPPKSAWKKCGGNSSTLTVLPGRQARWGDDQKGDRTYEIEEDKQSARISAGAVVVPGGPGPGGPG